MKSWIQFTFAIGLIVFSLSTFASDAHYGRIVSFGDSLSDLGTYEVVAGLKGGGKFTTNPGKIWIEVVAGKLGLPAKPSRHEGFGIPLQELGGFNYGQGGSRVLVPRQKLQADEVQTLTARPVVEQVEIFLSKYQNFNADDLVLVQGGPNDVNAQLSAVNAQKITPEEAVKNVAQVASDLANIVVHLKERGGQKVVVVNLPAIELTPRVTAAGPQAQQLVALMVSTFNAALAAQLSVVNAQLIDIYSFDVGFNNTYANLGFTDITHAACKTSILPLGSSLFCNSKNLVQPGADLKYKYADDLHPTTGFSRVVGEFVYGEIVK
jgi:phospholipase/lecithinase/hemolysin